MCEMFKPLIDSVYFLHCCLKKLSPLLWELSKSLSKNWERICGTFEDNMTFSCEQLMIRGSALMLFLTYDSGIKPYNLQRHLLKEMSLAKADRVQRYLTNYSQTILNSSNHATYFCHFLS